MTTITATPDTETASVTLQINKTSTVTKVLRSDSNGVSEVRGLASQFPSEYVQTEIYRNLVRNPSFENSTDNLAIPLFVDVSQLSGESFAVDGIWSLRMEVLSDESSYTYVRTEPIPVTANKYLGFSLNLRWIRESRIYRLCIVWMDSAGSAIGYADFGPMTYASINHHRDTMSALAPSGASSARVGVYFYDDATAATPPRIGTTYVTDSWSAVQADTAAEAEARSYDYFDGDSADDAYATYSWAGTPHASESIKGFGGTLILTDYEAASGAVSYMVQEETDTGAQVSTTLVLDDVWLFVPIIPNFSARVAQVTNYSSSRATNSTVHRVIGRADPLITLGRLGTRTGTLEIWCPDYESARDLEGVFDRGEIVMLRQNVTGLDMYFTGTVTSAAPYAPEGENHTQYRFTVEYTEVLRPVGALQGSLGWNFEMLASQYLSFDAVAASFEDFDALALNEES